MTMLEKVARAICLANTQGDEMWQAFVPEARAALEAAMTDTPDDIIATFGVNPFEIVNRHRAHWIVEKPDEDEIQYNVEPGWLAIRARDGAGNPISVEATRRPNFMATYEDDFDSTYRYYYFAPLPPTSAENARVAQEPVGWQYRYKYEGGEEWGSWINQRREDADLLLAHGVLTAEERRPIYTQDQLDAAVQAERERCAAACEKQAEVFLSPEYSTGQPLASFQERFACERCAAAIREGE